MSHHSRQERRKIPKQRRQDRAGGQRKLGAEVTGQAACTCSRHGPRNSWTERSVCSDHPLQRSFRLPHPSKPSAQANGDLQELGPRSSCAAEISRLGPRGPNPAPGCLNPQGPRSSLRPPARPSFSSSHWVPPTPILVPSAMSQSERRPSGLEGTAKILRLEEGIKDGGEGSPALGRHARPVARPPSAPSPHLLERALLLQRHEFVAPVLLGGTGLTQAHSLRAAVALERPQVARAQALLQPAQRRHQAVSAQRGAALVRA